MTRMVQVAVAGTSPRARRSRRSSPPPGSSRSCRPEDEADALTVLVPESSLEAAQDAIEALTEPDDLIETVTSQPPSAGRARIRPTPLTRSSEAGKERNEQRMARTSPTARPAKTLLDAEALGRHAVAHRARDHRAQRRPRHARARRHPHPRRPARRAPRGADRGAERGGDRARRGRHHLPPRRHRARRQAQPVVTRRRSTSSSRDDLRPRRRRPLHGPHDPSRDRDAVRAAAARRASSSPSSSTAATASCRSAPTTSARTCPPRGASGSRSSSTRSTAPTGSCSSTHPEEADDEASALDRRPRPATTSSASSRQRGALERDATRSCRRCRASSCSTSSSSPRRAPSSSFELAAKRLSADAMSLKAAGSSVDKGESLKDTVLTLAPTSPHAIVVRHPQIGAPRARRALLAAPRS